MRKIVMLIVTLALAATLHAADAVPTGHPDFYPSPERPIGWRGDGTGAWPGANCVTNWNAQTGENIVWKVETPGAGQCQPIVVGDRVFVTADPNLLLCYSAHDGKLLWQTAIDHTLCMNEEDRKAAREEQAFFDGKWKEYCEWRRKTTKLEEGILRISEIGPAPDNTKDRKALEKWEQSRREALKDLYAGRGNICVVLHLAEPGDAGYEKFQKLVMKDPELKALFDQVAAEQKENYWRKFNANENGLMWELNKMPSLDKRYSEAQKKYDIWCTVSNNWIGYTTYSFSTPITDGKYVYVTTANNAVAAVDLNGKVAWMIWEHRPGRSGIMHTQYVPSPALMDGKLLVSQMGLLRVYDVTDGKKIWEIWGPNAVANGNKGKQKNYFYRGDPESTSPMVGHLSLPDGKSLGIVALGDGADTGANIWRLDDGKLLLAGKGILPATGAGATPVLQHETGILIGANKVVQLRATSRDEVVAELLWEGKDLIKFSSRCLTDDRFYTSNSEKGKEPVVAYDVHTGKIMKALKGNAAGFFNSPIIAGTRLYTFVSNNSWGDHFLGRPIVSITDLNTEVSNIISSPYIDNCITDGDFGFGTTPFQQNSSPSAQANRLFFRSRGLLWCIGDPKQPFPTPKDCPADAKVEK